MMFYHTLDFIFVCCWDQVGNNLDLRLYFYGRHQPLLKKRLLGSTAVITETYNLQKLTKRKKF